MTFLIPSIDKDSIGNVVEEANKNNFGIELFDFVNPEILNGDIDSYTVELKKQIVNFSGLLALHAPFYDLNPISIDEDIKKITLKKYNKISEISKFLKVKNIIFHTPYLPTAKLSFYRQYFIDSYNDFWKNYIKFFEDNSITVLLENTLEQEPSILYPILTEINSPFFKSCLDIGHVNVNSNLPVNEWISSLKDFLVYMHLHNNDGKYDLHDSLLKGSLNFQDIYEVLKSFKLSVDMSFEIFDKKNLIESLEMVKNIENESKVVI